MKKILRPKRKNDLRRSDSSQIQEELGLEPTFPDLRCNAFMHKDKLIEVNKTHANYNCITMFINNLDETLSTDTIC